MSARHTAGPWLGAAKPSSVVGWPVVGPEGRLICNLAWQPKPEHVDAATYDAFYRECQANARLIAVAPDLLDLARTFLDYANDMAAGHLKGPAGRTYKTLGAEDVARIESAIAKAERQS